MTILVTGVAGYIGSHTCVELLDAGYDVIVIDDLSNSSEKSLNRVMEITNKYIKFYNGDILEKNLLKKIFSENNIDAVIHFAGFKAVGESVSKPLDYYYNNITGIITLCQVMKEFCVKRIVFSSSAAVYGLPDNVPITEDFPLCATNPYGRTKIMIEQILNDLYISDKNWSISILRYFNPIGAHKSGKIGECPNGIPNNLMPYITQVAIGKLKELTIYGNDYPTIDGTGVRDYIHVVDIAKGHIKALEKIMSSKGIEAYNLGTGKGYSVLEIVNAFQNSTGINIPYKITVRRQGDIAECYADSRKAFSLLNFKAEKDIYEMCEDSWRWQNQNKNGYED